MKKKPLSSRFSKPKTRNSPEESWHNGADVEIHRYARSLQQAAKVLTERLEVDG
jgi:hypothetical protein